jgi:putative ABC transport system permease protein
MAYAVGQRTHEIGVRLALGAEPGTVLRLILQGLRLALAGLALGLAGALALTRVVYSLLFEIKPADPTTFAVVTAVFLAVALIVCWGSGETSYPR